MCLVLNSPLTKVQLMVKWPECATGGVGGVGVLELSVWVTWGVKNEGHLYDSFSPLIRFLTRRWKTSKSVCSTLPSSPASGTLPHLHQHLQDTYLALHQLYLICADLKDNGTFNKAKCSSQRHLHPANIRLKILLTLNRGFIILLINIRAIRTHNSQ